MRFLLPSDKATPNQILVSHPQQTENRCGRAGFWSAMVVNITSFVGNDRHFNLAKIDAVYFCIVVPI